MRITPRMEIEDQQAARARGADDQVVIVGDRKAGEDGGRRRRLLLARTEFPVACAGGVAIIDSRPETGDPPRSGGEHQHLGAVFGDPVEVVEHVARRAAAVRRSARILTAADCRQPIAGTRAELLDARAQRDFVLLGIPSETSSTTGTHLQRLGKNVLQRPADAVGAALPIALAEKQVMSSSVGVHFPLPVSSPSSQLSVPSYQFPVISSQFPVGWNEHGPPPEGGSHARREVWPVPRPCISGNWRLENWKLATGNSRST